MRMYEVWTVSNIKVATFIMKDEAIAYADEQGHLAFEVTYKPLEAKKAEK